MSDRADSYFYMFTGDYLRDTMHLTTRQHGAYTLLLMHYYGTMKPLPLSQDTLRTIARLSDKDWKVDGPVVLAFFNLEGDGWHQKRADKEIASAHKRYERAVKGAAAKHGASSRQAADKQAASACLIDANPNPNHSRTPLRGGSTRGARRAAAPGQTAAPPVVPGWEQTFPKWAEFREKIGEAHWLNWFDQCRTNGSETTILAPSEFQAEQLKFRYLTTLKDHFGPSVYIKFDPEKWNPKAGAKP